MYFDDNPQTPSIEYNDLISIASPFGAHSLAVTRIKLLNNVLTASVIYSNFLTSVICIPNVHLANARAHRD